MFFFGLLHILTTLHIQRCLQLKPSKSAQHLPYPSFQGLVSTSIKICKGDYFIIRDLLISIQQSTMYLSSFYKLKFEKYIFNARVFGPFAIPAALWFGWLFYPSLYNCVYTDFIPPSKGVTRRIQEDDI